MGEPYTWNTFTAEVKQLLTVDAARKGTTDFIDLQIRAAVLDLQSFAPLERYRKGHVDTLEPAALTNSGACSVLALTQGAQIRDAYVIRRKIGATTLTGTAEATAGNPLITGTGTTWLADLTPGDVIRVGDGLSFADLLVLQVLSDTSALLGAIDEFSQGEPTEGAGQTITKFERYRHACEPWDWQDRQSLIARQACLNDNRPFMALSPNGSTALIHPQVLSSDPEGYACQLEVNWDGVKIEWGDGDVTPFDEGVVACVADWVKGECFRHVDHRLDLWETFLKPPGPVPNLGGTYYQKRAVLAKNAKRMANIDS